MSKFTPGPWHTEPEPATCDRVTSGEQTVCWCDSVHFSDQENDANARLIAKAPEMYEALRECVIELTTLVNDIPLPKGDSLEIQETIDAGMAILTEIDND